MPIRYGKAYRCICSIAYPYFPLQGKLSKKIFVQALPAKYRYTKNSLSKSPIRKTGWGPIGL